MARKETNIDRFAKILIENLPSNRPCPDENGYVSLGARLIQGHLGEYYKGAGLEPPQMKTIRSWFYYGCPDWAIAVLYHTLGASSARNLVAR